MSLSNCDKAGSCQGAARCDLLAMHDLLMLTPVQCLTSEGTADPPEPGRCNDICGATPAGSGGDVRRLPPRPPEGRLRGSPGGERGEVAPRAAARLARGRCAGNAAGWAGCRAGGRGGNSGCITAGCDAGMPASGLLPRPSTCPASQGQLSPPCRKSPVLTRCTTAVGHYIEC